MDNDAALRLTLITGEAHYYSRARAAVWHKGATSGLKQQVVEMRIIDDQDEVWFRVEVAGGASCHVRNRSCLYRAIAADGSLQFAEIAKVFDPVAVYGTGPNPTLLCWTAIRTS